MQLTPELVALTIKGVRDDGPEPGWTPLTEAELDELVARIENEAGSDPLLVFAYGSLIWNPEFEPASRQRATAYGWHRSFSLKIERWRATSTQPGLMLALERGGQCNGIVFELSAEQCRRDLRALVAREIKYREVKSMVRWVYVKTANGVQRALTFWASTSRLGLTKPLPDEQSASLIASACGQGGSCAEYLHKTIVDLQAEGIRDRNLWRLQALVAAEITARHRAMAQEGLSQREQEIRPQIFDR
ncbi:gamma-glutamylcyclotransferase [Agrobacterium vitis]|uniref:glutathione-specific gamma-glutamylcyclotransferase n=1 Tax=Agrobacterium vitis TaxID=373 RepID=A0ABD6GI92_AGRVI|nr:gamma-glutamylcyclotransferase [Agrobacterium vitis]MUO78845.1 gamma-glutamylcyclotransferase [Agrobacterium vitis]MUO94408.1 gamma-glutamylcyclotransferase [Agrobacterium vitis]MUP06067.1 gamma-glutamylcyclotransferase [Agrobacterium vitis]MUZ82164.1 gamma-glutamylcyclotransferase [Agrobacterium vitis]MVA11475.1 gamma-glutamylcyclotransferase [Agrobacterium vitis]